MRLKATFFSAVWFMIAAVFAQAGLAAVTPASAANDPLQILSENDVDLYKEVFAAQENGRWGEADRKIAQIENDVLMGYVKFQRYMHPTAYRSTYDELKRWMAYYPDHPEASKIYKLALKRRPKRASPPVRPIPRKWRSPEVKPRHPDLQADYDKTSGPRLRQIEGRVRYLSKKEKATTALKEITRHLKNRAITERQFDRMRSWIAASLYYQGYIDTAKRIAGEVAARNGESAVLAHWVSGVIAFREGDMPKSYAHFSEMAKNPYQEDDLRAGAGFWAARAALASGKVDGVAPNLEIAANYPFTFYGQLAIAQIGREHKYDWSVPAVTEAGVARIAATAPAINRAIALAQTGREIDANTEMRWINGAIDDHLDRDLLAIATALDLPAAQIDIALASKNRGVEAGLYPIPHYAPQRGFKTDRAVLYALMRQESKFKVEATSRVGARGLMQLMPRTASYVAKDRSLRRGKARNRLYDPAYNLELGQQYVNQLINVYADGDLFHMAVAYNGGPGNLRRWKRKMEIEDPLLFIESIPNPESRDFVEKVLTNIWVYRARLGQPAPTRDKVAAGKLPLYEALDQLAGDGE